MILIHCVAKWFYYKTIGLNWNELVLHQKLRPQCRKLFMNFELKWISLISLISWSKISGLLTLLWKSSAAIRYRYQSLKYCRYFGLTVKKNHVFSHCRHKFINFVLVYMESSSVGYRRGSGFVCWPNLDKPSSPYSVRLQPILCRPFPCLRLAPVLTKHTRALPCLYALLRHCSRHTIVSVEPQSTQVL